MASRGYPGFVIWVVLLSFLLMVAVGLMGGAWPKQALSATESTLTFSAQADARVEKSSPRKNYGGSSQLSADASPVVESYLSFAVSGVSGAVSSVKLRLYAYNGSADGPAVYPTSNGWTETGITWNNRPARTGGATDDKGKIGTKSWVEYDVTPLVAGDGTYSFNLATTSADNVNIYSRQSTNASLRPQLVLTVAGEPDTTAPDTAIDSGPSGTVDSGSASFAFSSDEAGSTFECALDGAAFGGCASPEEYAGLPDGEHSFQVRATDAAGNTDPTPASRTWTVGATSATVSATVETDPVSHAGDAADDAAIWRDDGDPSRSTLIGTDKQGGMEVYALDGSRIQSTATTDFWNNVDTRDGFPLGGRDVSLVVASKQNGLDLGVWKVDPATRNLVDVSAGVSSALDNNYGLCMYQSGGKTYVFVNSEAGYGQNAGEVEQIELFDDGSGKVAGRTVRTFDVGSQTEGCVADEELGHLYIGEEDVGIWKYGADPGSGDARTSVDEATSDGRLQADVEGLTIAYGANGIGYLIASSQGNGSFVVYKREGNNDYVKTFKIEAGDGIDGVGGTDGIDVAATDLGPDFPYGVFVAHDGKNDDGNQNFKLVPYQRIVPSAP